MHFDPKQDETGKLAGFIKAGIKKHVPSAAVTQMGVDALDTNCMNAAGVLCCGQKKSIAIE